MIELIKVEYICHKCIKTVSEIILIQVPISFQAVHLHSSPYKKRKHWIKSEENKKKVFTASAVTLGMEDTGLPMYAKQKKWTCRDEQLRVCRSEYWQWFQQRVSCLSNFCN